MTTTKSSSAAARAAAAAALAEDASGKDITTVWSVPEGLIATAEISARQPGVVAGLPVAREAFGRSIRRSGWRPVADGARVAAGAVLVRLSGPARSLITGERTALNFLQRMCGIATVTDHFVQAVAGTKAQILDTRKTAPGCGRWTSTRSPRAAAQRPAQSGGDGPAEGEPHRRGGRGDLGDQGGSAGDGRVRDERGGRCRGADRLAGREAMEAGAGWMMLDNMEATTSKR